MLAGQCWQCLRVARLDPAKLVRRLDPDLPVSALRGRLRCIACRSHRIDFAVFRFETELRRWLQHRR